MNKKEHFRFAFVKNETEGCCTVDSVPQDLASRGPHVDIASILDRNAEFGHYFDAVGGGECVA